MIWSYVFLLDFLIPFLCDPDLQCSRSVTGREGYMKLIISSCGASVGDSDFAPQRDEDLDEKKKLR